MNHECDMLALDSQGRFTEIEIKVSASGLSRLQEVTRPQVRFHFMAYLCDAKRVVQ